MPDFFGGGETQVNQNANMTDEQRAFYQSRRDMASYALLPYANQMRQQRGQGPITPGTPGWDEDVLAGAGWFTGKTPGTGAWGVSPGGQNWLDATQTYIGSVWPSLAQNPYRYGANGFEDPMIAGLQGFYDSELNRISPQRADWNPEATTYGSVFSGPDANTLNVDWGGQGDRAQGGYASGAAVEDIDPAYAVKQAQTLFRDVVAPGITAGLTSSGMGRSGAEAEIQSMRGKEIALPISQQVLDHESKARLEEAELATRASIASAQNQTQASVANAQLGQRMAEVQYLQRVQAALQAQSLSATSERDRQQIGARLAEVNAQLGQASQALRANFAQTGVDMGMRFAQARDARDVGMATMIPGLMGLGLSAAEYPNQLARADEQRQLAALMGFLGITPQPSGGAATTTQQLPFDYSNLMSLISSGAGIAGAAMMA